MWVTLTIIKEKPRVNLMDENTKFNGFFWKIIDIIFVTEIS